jgi:hypothetical protein
MVASVKRNATLPKIALGNLVRLTIIGTFFSAISSLSLRKKNF